MNGVVLLYRDFSPEWIDVLKDTGLKKLGLHVNAQQNSVGEFLGWLDLNRPLVERAEECGLTVEYYLHALGYLMPADFAKRREYWRSDGSERVRGCNCCPSSPALFYAEKNAERLAAGLKQRSHGYHFWTDDDFGRDVSCKCERCRPLGPTAQNMLLYGAMARGVRKYDEKAVLPISFYGNEISTEKQGIRTVSSSNTRPFYAGTICRFRQRKTTFTEKGRFRSRARVSARQRARILSQLRLSVVLPRRSVRAGERGRCLLQIAGRKGRHDVRCVSRKRLREKTRLRRLERYAALWRD